VDLARRRLTLASARGAGEHYAELRRAETEARLALCQPLLASARQAAGAGDYFRALRHGREAASRFPEVPETYAYLADWLLTVGQSQGALSHLEALMVMPGLSTDAVERGLAVADRLQTDRDRRGQAAFVADVLRVRRAQSRSGAAGDAPGLRRDGTAGDNDLVVLRDRLTAWANGAGRPPAVARFAHVAVFTAGCAAELAGDLPQAAALYADALARCPLHRPSVEHLLALPAEVAGAAQDGVRAQLKEAGLDRADLQRELVVAGPGVALRHLSVAPSTIDPTLAVTVSAVVEITAEALALPSLHLDFGCADGSAFSGSIAAQQWNSASDRPRLGQLLAARVELVPAIAALKAGFRLPDGPVVLRIRGAGRDAGFTFHYPAFVVRRGGAPSPP